MEILLLPNLGTLFLRLLLHPRFVPNASLKYFIRRFRDSNEMRDNVSAMAVHTHYNASNLLQLTAAEKFLFLYSLCCCDEFILIIPGSIMNNSKYNIATVKARNRKSRSIKTALVVILQNCHVIIFLRGNPFCEKQQ